MVYISFESSWTDGCEVNGEVTPGINNFFVDEPVCYKNMIVPIDYCNTKGTHGKSGGSFNVFCGRVMIYPVPDKCSESGWIGTHWDRIFARIEALESFTNKPDLNVTGVKYVADTRKLLETYEPVTDTENLIESSDTVETTEKLLEDDAPVTDVGKLYHAEQRRFDPDTGHNIERRQPINDPEDASPARVIRRDDDVFCYNECFGVTRLQAATAIDWFCAYHAGTELWSNLDGSFLAVTGN